MASSYLRLPIQESIGFYQASIGKKMVMAVTGCILVLFVIGHLLGNLQVYLGPDKLNSYARFLRSTGSLLWIVRAVLFVSAVLHVVTGILLWLENQRARPIGYRRRQWVEATLASRTMIVTGLAIAAFVVYHLLHLTFGTVHPSFNHELDVYSNVVKGFQQAPAAVAYIGFMIFLGFHLSHGIWSMFQSVGWNHPRYMPYIQRAAVVLAVLIVAGNIAIPLSILVGIVR